MTTRVVGYPGSMHVERLSPALRPFLPGRADTSGGSLSALKAACDAHVQAPTPAPYPKEMSRADAVATSRDLSALAGRVQADFRLKVGDPAADMGILQLHQAAERLAEAKAAEAKEKAGAISGLKRGYFKQVGKTAAWMAATVGSLVVGGLVPNPVSAIAIAATAGMCIRSINKSREKHAQLQKQVPQLEAQMKFAREVAADAAFCAPFLKGWSNLLTPSQQAAA